MNSETPYCSVGLFKYPGDLVDPVLRLEPLQGVSIHDILSVANCAMRARHGMLDDPILIGVHDSIDDKTQLIEVPHSMLR